MRLRFTPLLSPTRHAHACRGHPRLKSSIEIEKPWMAGTSPAMTMWVTKRQRRRYYTVDEAADAIVILNVKHKACERDHSDI